MFRFRCLQHPDKWVDTPNGKRLTEQFFYNPDDLWYHMVIEHKQQADLRIGEWEE